MLKRTSQICFALMILVVLAHGQTADTWVTDFEKALAKSKETKKPIMICMHKLKEIACTRMTKLYQDADVQQQMSAFILVPTCLDTHPTTKIKIGEEMKEVCSAFPGITCAEHIAAERQIHERYFDGPNVKVPQHIVLDAEGKVLLNKIYEMKKTAFVDFCGRGVAAFKGLGQDALDAQTKAYLELVKSGNVQEREASVKALLDFNNEFKTDLLYDAIEEIKDEKDRAICIRAMGYDQYSHAGRILVRWLEDDSVFIQNCTVVSLEETHADGAARKLLDLYASAKDAELKKDCLRALGPCGEGKDEVKKLLMSLVANGDERIRAAVYMSLGGFVDDPEVRSTLATRYKKEGKDVTLKTAILWAYRMSRDASLIGEIDKLVGDDKNDQIKSLAESTKNVMQGKEESGGWRQLRGLLKPLYARDKIIRNRIKEWGQFGGGR